MLSVIVNPSIHKCSPRFQCVFVSSMDHSKDSIGTPPSLHKKKPLVRRASEFSTVSDILDGGPISPRRASTCEGISYSIYSPLFQRWGSPTTGSSVMLSVARSLHLITPTVSEVDLHQGVGSGVQLRGTGLNRNLSLASSHEGCVDEESSTSELENELDGDNEVFLCHILPQVPESPLTETTDEAAEEENGNDTDDEASEISTGIQSKKTKDRINSNSDPTKERILQVARAKVRELAARKMQEMDATHKTPPDVIQHPVLEKVEEEKPLPTSKRLPPTLAQRRAVFSMTQSSSASSEDQVPVIKIVHHHPTSTSQKSVIMTQSSSLSSETEDKVPVMKIEHHLSSTTSHKSLRLMDSRASSLTSVRLTTPEDNKHVPELSKKNIFRAAVLKVMRANDLKRQLENRRDAKKKPLRLLKERHPALDEDYLKDLWEYGMVPDEEVLPEEPQKKVSWVRLLAQMNLRNTLKNLRRPRSRNNSSKDEKHNGAKSSDKESKKTFWKPSIASFRPRTSSASKKRVTSVSESAKATPITHSVTEPYFTKNSDKRNSFT